MGQLDRSRYPALLPVVDALNAARLLEFQKLGHPCGAAQLFDEFSVRGHERQ